MALWRVLDINERRRAIIQKPLFLFLADIKNKSEPITINYE